MFGGGDVGWGFNNWLVIVLFFFYNEIYVYVLRYNFLLDFIKFLNI